MACRLGFGLLAPVQTGLGPHYAVRPGAVTVGQLYVQGHAFFHQRQFRIEFSALAPIEAEHRRDAERPRRRAEHDGLREIAVFGHVQMEQGLSMVCAHLRDIVELRKGEQQSGFSSDARDRRFRQS